MGITNFVALTSTSRRSRRETGLYTLFGAFAHRPAPLLNRLALLLIGRVESMRLSATSLIAADWPTIIAASHDHTITIFPR